MFYFILQDINYKCVICVHSFIISNLRQWVTESVLLTYLRRSFIEISSKHDKSSCQCCFSLLFKATDHCKLNKKKIQLRSLLPPIRATEIVECVRKYVDGISCICKYAYVYVHKYMDKICRAWALIYHVLPHRVWSYW